MMNRKLRWFLAVVLLPAFGVWLEPTRIVWGWLQGEAFFKGRPTSWWANELANWQFVDVGFPGQEKEGFDPRATVFITPKNDDGWLDEYFRRFNESRLELVGKGRWEPTLLQGHRESEPVLRELEASKDPLVREMAVYGLKILAISGEQPEP